MNIESSDQRLSRAIALQQQGQLSDAEKLYAKLLSENSQNAPALHFMGLLLHQRNQHEAANRLLQQAQDINPKNTVFLTNFARVLMNQGKFQQALPLFQQLLDLNPQNAPAWYELGLALSHLGGKEDAVDCWQRALAIEPRFKETSLALGAALRDLAYREKAETVYRHAMTHAPHDPELGCALAELFVEMGCANEAIGLLDEIRSIRGQRSDIDYYRGIAQLTRGQFEDAEKSFRQTIARDPQFYHAYVHLAAGTKLELSDSSYQYLEDIAHNGRLDEPEQQVNVHFSLGKILQDNREYKHAFEHFDAGNQACRKLRPYSHEYQERQAASLRSHLDPDYLDTMRAHGNYSALPVFILGMPRSGTTLTEQILARHPEVHAGGEMVLLQSILRQHLGKQYRRDLAAGLIALDNDALSGIATELEAGLRQIAAGAAHVTDKMPSNFLIAGWLNALLPNARIIHCRRDPLDTCVSCYTTLFNRSHEFTNRLDDLGLYYRMYLDMMAHWRKALPADRLLEIDYEALIENPEPVVRRMLEFIGLPWHPDCLAFGHTSETIQTASVMQVRQPLYTSSIGRWRHYAEHLGPLRAALGMNG